MHADSDPWLPFSWAGRQLSQEKEQESGGLFQIFCPDLTAGTCLQHKEVFVITGCAEFMLISVTLVRMEGNIFCLFDCRRNICTPFPKCWMIDTKCWSEKYFGIFCINYREHMQYPSLVNAVTLLPLLSVHPCLPPSWLGSCPSLRGCRGRCKVGHH